MVLSVVALLAVPVPGLAGPAVDYATHGMEHLLAPLETTRRASDRALAAGLESLRAGLASRDRSAFERAAAQLAAVRVQHPSSEAAPRATLLQGIAELVLGDSGRGQDTLRTLTRTSPADPHSAHAFTLLGDLAVAEGRLDEAWLLYERATTYLLPDLDGYAHYRAGWAHWEVGRTADALDHMADALQSPSLGHHARSDLEAWTAALGTLPPALTARIDERSASGSCRDRIEPLQTRIEAAPLHPEAPWIALERVSCLAEVGPPEAAVDAAEEMREAYGNGSIWSRTNHRKRVEGLTAVRKARRVAGATAE